MNEEAKVSPSPLNLLAFLLLFLIPASITYFSGVLLTIAIMNEAAEGIAASTPMFRPPPAGEDALTADHAIVLRALLLVGCYAVMILACWIRGRAVGKPWLSVFPVVAAIFDIWLAILPLVPTVMNGAVLVVGIPQPSGHVERRGAR